MAKHPPVCLTYALLQSGQVSLYTPNSENLSRVGFLWESRFPIVFVVWNAILSLNSVSVEYAASIFRTALVPSCTYNLSQYSNP